MFWHFWTGHRGKAAYWVEVHRGQCFLAEVKLLHSWFSVSKLWWLTRPQKASGHHSLQCALCLVCPLCLPPVSLHSPPRTLLSFFFISEVCWYAEFQLIKWKCNYQLYFINRLLSFFRLISQIVCCLWYNIM